jgi:hypothetical protein
MKWYSIPADNTQNGGNILKHTVGHPQSSVHAVQYLEVYTSFFRKATREIRKCLAHALAELDIS